MEQSAKVGRDCARLERRERLIISLNLPSLEFDIKKLRVKKFLIHRTNTKRCDLELYTWYRVLKFPSLIHGDETGRDKRYWRRRVLI